jgi:hypothetical protein
MSKPPEKTEADLLYGQMIDQTKEGTRKRRNLEIVWQALADLRGKDSPDYSIARVGAAVEKLGGPKTQSLRNKDGAHFRKLIESFARSAGAPVKKAPMHPLSQAELALEQITNIGARATLKLLLVDYRREKSENDRLRHAFKSLSVDATKPTTVSKPAVYQTEQETCDKPIELERAFIKAFEMFLGRSWMDERHFSVEADGSIIDQKEGGWLVAPPGFLDGLQRLIQAGQLNSLSPGEPSLRSFGRFLSTDWMDERGWAVEADGSIIDQTDGGRVIAPAGFAHGLRWVIQFTVQR